MRKLDFLKILATLFLLLSLQGCQAVGDIFKAGMWSGVIIVVLIIGVIVYFLSKGSKKV